MLTLKAETKTNETIEIIQVDTFSVESKIFPRADALAERLWSNPSQKWYKAEQRMLQQRWRLTQRKDIFLLTSNQY